MKKNKNPKEPKKSFFKRTGEWCKLTWDSYVVELEDRIFRSWKRIIKFIGISCIPIIYGVLCVIAFWNPIDELGKAPTVVLNNENSIILVQSSKENPSKTTNNNKDNYAYGPLNKIVKTTTNSQVITPERLNEELRKPEYGGYDTDNYPIHYSEMGSWVIPSQLLETEAAVAGVEATLNRLLNEEATKGAPDIVLTTENDKQEKQRFQYDNTNPTFSLKVASGWDMMKKGFEPKTDPNKKDTDYKFSSMGADGKQLTNVKYVNDPKEIEKQWQGTKYYVQFNIPDGYMEKLTSYLGAMMTSPSDSDQALNDLVNSMKPLDIWTTFERNFIFGYILNTASSVLDGVVIKSIPALVNSTLVSQGGAKISYKGAVIRAAIGANEQITPTLDDATEYVIPTAANLPMSSDNKVVKGYSLFGNTGAAAGASADEVGGKFIATIQTLLTLANDPNFGNTLGSIGKALGISPDIQNIISLITEIADAVKSVLGSNVTDDVLIALNNEAYEVARTGKTPSANSNLAKIIKAIIKSTTGKDIGDITSLKFTPLFNSDGSIMPLKNDAKGQVSFSQNFDKFISLNQDTFFGATTAKELLPKIFSSAISSATHGLTPEHVTNLTIQGKQFGIYGFGLGQFFLVIGLYIGCLLQTFIFDRAKRLSRAKWSNWYISKFMLFATVTFFQTTLEVWIAYAVGWHELGATTMCYIWLMLLFADLVFITIVQSLWFLVEDEAIGRFCCVLVMVFSLTAGGGTFPAFSQFGFFNAISYVVPFTYVLRATGEIIYGVGDYGTTATSTKFILQQFGFLWIYIAIFFPIGLFVAAPALMKDMDYGSRYGHEVSKGLEELGRTEELNNFRTVKWTSRTGKKHYKYNWKALPDGFNPDLYFKCHEMSDYEGSFKWWRRKEHDFVQKPNYSDEDTITRNE
ncbi:hypothetical protein [Mesoplasma lactucae]|uniref:Uncharacterized protein n=1 Tax=Mesoplasma lactucae ATCC 49193 TaxID=81460 RepID=A0A291IRS5_9MOLU|nr:hypothetical protein [Mesoplasma lactucae]ATG97397.1 hypothetical protein CP520_01320 [Mesoplasma lactucae ATCC 49193]ATZ20150.1 hypothetical protein MLACT_v1c03290 [Mesoplasma lactucae ATCC 49193]MCL8216898.1 hypothetical protein [Mesoplasma lactucae ATCC 49193]